MLPPALLDLALLTQRHWRGLTEAMTQTFVEAAAICLHHHRPDENVVELLWSSEAQARHPPASD